ncbi:MAG: hypothetical protein JWO05_2502 [Gemmatimonadetes bacterium]|nr:hypothetical protein [Gemmatimonadota bacterium]
MPDPGDELELREGRSLVRVNLWRIFWVSAVVTWLAAGSAGSNPVATWGRLAVIALCCVLVWRGSRRALWALGLFTVFAGAAILVIAFAMKGLDWIDRVVFAIAGGVQVLAFVILVKAPEVRAFMAAQKERYARAT